MDRSVASVDGMKVYKYRPFRVDSIGDEVVDPLYHLTYSGEYYYIFVPPKDKAELKSAYKTGYAATNTINRVDDKTIKASEMCIKVYDENHDTCKVIPYWEAVNSARQLVGSDRLMSELNEELGPIITNDEELIGETAAQDIFDDGNAFAFEIGDFNSIPSFRAKLEQYRQSAAYAGLANVRQRRGAEAYLGRLEVFVLKAFNLLNRRNIFFQRFRNPVNPDPNLVTAMRRASSNDIRADANVLDRVIPAQNNVTSYNIPAANNSVLPIGISDTRGGVVLAGVADDAGGFAAILAAVPLVAARPAAGGPGGPVVDDLDVFINYMKSQDLPIPCQMLIFRPNIVHRMGSAIMMKAGVETGETLVGYRSLTLSDDGDAGVHKGNFHCWTGSYVKEPKNVLHIPDIIFGGYVGGNTNNLFKTPTNVAGAGAAQNGSGDNLVLIQPLDKRIEEYHLALPLSGKYDDFVNNVGEDPWGADILFRPTDARGNPIARNVVMDPDYISTGSALPAVMKVNNSDLSCLETHLSNQLLVRGGQYNYNRHTKGWEKCMSRAHCGMFKFFNNYILQFYIE